MPATPAPSRAFAYLLLTLTVLFWSGNWVVGRWIRGDVPPIALSFWRWVIAFACLLPWAWPQLRRQWRETLAHWRVLAMLGLFGGACHNALTYTGLAHTTATNGVLLASATPIMIIGLSWALFGKRLRPLNIADTRSSRLPSACHAIAARCRPIRASNTFLLTSCTSPMKSTQSELACATSGPSARMSSLV